MGREEVLIGVVGGFGFKGWFGSGGFFGKGVSNFLGRRVEEK